MNREELIEEILAYQKAQLEKVDTPTLKAHVVDFRTTAFRDGLVEEAGIDIHQSMFGSHVQDKDD